MSERERPVVQRQMVFADGVDDRPEVRGNESSEQTGLVTSTADDQQTLDGEQAAGQSLF